MTLTELATKYNTDKLQHGYLPFYEAHLPKNPRRILEIGVDTGASIRMWREYFPEAEIHGLDLFADKPIPEIEGVTFWKGSQTDTAILEQLARLEFDVIIEDASHGCRNHWITLFGLIDSCKQYYIEDLHTCGDSFWRQGLSYENTVLGMIKTDRFPFNHVLDNDKIVLIYANP